MASRDEIVALIADAIEEVLDSPDIRFNDIQKAARLVYEDLGLKQLVHYTRIQAPVLRAAHMGVDHLEEMARRRASHDIALRLSEEKLVLERSADTPEGHRHMDFRFWVMDPPSLRGADG